jgi:hypothetical protein
LAAGVEHLDDIQVQLLVRQHADDSDRVIHGGDRSGHVGAMAVLVGGPVAGTGQIDAIEMVAEVVFVGRIDPRIDDAQRAVARGGIGNLVGLDHRDAVGHGLGRRGCAWLCAHDVARHVFLDEQGVRAGLQLRQSAPRHVDRDRIDFLELENDSPTRVRDRCTHRGGRAGLESDGYPHAFRRVLAGRARWRSGKHECREGNGDRREFRCAG